MTTGPVTEIGNIGLASIPGWGMFSGAGTNTYAIDGAQDPLEDVPELRWPNSVRTFHRMRTDAQIDALQRGVTIPVRKQLWQIAPNGARDEVVESIATQLNLSIVGTKPDDVIKRGRKRFNFDEFMRLALLAPTVYGHMFFEIVGYINANPFEWRLRKLAPRMPQTISAIDVARDGGLVQIRQWDTSYWQGVPIPVENLVAFPWDMEGASWTGRSMLRPLYRNWLLKDRLLRIDAIKNERFGAGIPWAKSPTSTADPAEYSRLAQSMRSSETGGAGLPGGASIGIEGIKGTLPDTLASIVYHDESMAKTFLAMFMNLGGNARSASRALGDTFEQFFHDSLAGFANWFMNIVNEHVIEDIVDWNWGEDEQAPLLVWHENQNDPLDATQLATLVTSGALTVDADMQNWVRHRYGMPDYLGTALPTPSPAAPVTNVASSHRHVDAHLGEAHDQSTHGNRISTPANGENPDITINDDGTITLPLDAYRALLPKGREARVTFLGSGEPGPKAASQTVGSNDNGHRKLTTQEQAAQTDFVAMQETWDQATADLVAAWGDIKAKQITELVKQAKQAVKGGDAVALAEIAVDPTGAELILEHTRQLAEGAMAAAVSEADKQSVIIADVSIDDVSDILEQQANATASLLARSISDTAARQALTRYGVGGATPKAVADGLREHLEGLTDTYLNDMLGGALTQAQNTARRVVMDAAPTDKRIYASELLDLNTCTNCAQVDGTEYSTITSATGDYPTGGYKDCLGGPRCRGTLVAVYGEPQEE